ncbi:MAG: LCP family protein [Bacteroidales bacterium]
MKISRILFRLLIVIVVSIITFITYIGIQSAHTWKDTYHTTDKKQLFEDISENSENLITILLMGIDTQGLATNNHKGRSDANILMLLNLQTGKITAVSIPRDTRVELHPGRYEKLGHAYMYSPELSIKVVEGLLQFPVNFYIAVNEKAFGNIIDAIGGIEIDAEKVVASKKDNIKEGDQRMNGKTTLDYIRFRNDDKHEGDFGRMRRQQQVVDAILHQALKPKIFINSNKLFKIAKDNIRHNIPTKIIRTKGCDLLSISPDNFEKITLQGRNYEVDSIWYVIPDRQNLIDVRKELRIEFEKSK